METTVFTHACWQVRAGSEAAFIEAWKNLGQVFSSLPVSPAWGTLIRSAAEPSVFYSFGPWPSAEAVQAMREDSVAREALDAVHRHCIDATPGLYHQVAHVESATAELPRQR